MVSYPPQLLSKPCGFCYRQLEVDTVTLSYGKAPKNEFRVMWRCVCAVRGRTYCRPSFLVCLLRGSCCGSCCRSWPHGCPRAAVGQSRGASIGTSRSPRRLEAHRETQIFPRPSTLLSEPRLRPALTTGQGQPTRPSERDLEPTIDAAASTRRASASA